MKAEYFSAKVRRLDNKAIIDLHGSMNSQADDKLFKAYKEAESSDPDMILLNFSAVDYINSTGIAVIVDFLSQARKNQCKVGYFGLSDHYLQIFRITRLSDYMEDYQNELSASLN